MEEKRDINALIGELVSYGMENSLVEPADEVYVTNQLLSLFGLNEYEKKGIPAQKRPVHEILDDMLDYAVELGVENGFIQEGGTAEESFIPAFDCEGI